MTLSFTAPSFFVSGIPFSSTLLVTPATTILPYSSKSTTDGLVFTSNVSVNCMVARITSPNLYTLPRLVLPSIPEFFHFWLLDLMKKLVVLVHFPYCNEHVCHMGE